MPAAKALHLGYTPWQHLRVVYRYLQGEIFIYLMSDPIGKIFYWIVHHSSGAERRSSSRGACLPALFCSMLWAGS